MTLSVCILVKDESEIIGKCIESVKDNVEEIIIVDNGSTDDSKSIAEKYGCKIIDFPSADLDGGRNEYMKSATEPWILVLDADERMTDKGLNELKRNLRGTPDNVFGLRLPRYEYIGNGKWSAIDILRVCRNNHKIGYNSTEIHATFGPSIVNSGGSIQRLYDAPIHHFDILFNERTSKKRDFYISKLLSEIKVNPEPYLISFLGVEYAALGDNDEAIKQYKRAIELDKDNMTKARLYLAQLYLSINNLDAAEMEINNLLFTNKTLLDRNYTLLAEIAFRKNESELAQKFSALALNIDPNAAHYHINLGSLLIDKDPESAIVHFEKAIRLNPYLLDPNIYRKGETPNIFLQQSSFLSSVTNIFEHMASSHLKLGNVEVSSQWNEKECHILSEIKNKQLLI